MKSLPMMTNDDLIMTNEELVKTHDTPMKMDDNGMKTDEKATECKHVLLGKNAPICFADSNPIAATTKKTLRNQGFLFFCLFAQRKRGSCFGIFVPFLFRALPANPYAIRLCGLFFVPFLFRGLQSPKQ